MAKDEYCSYCGGWFGEQNYPKVCAGCKAETYANPVPVAVALLPVGESGLLIARRNIPPVGKIALPGGYIDFGEPWRNACVRELFEETGIICAPEAVKLAGIRDVARGILIFGLLPPIDRLPDFEPNEETQELIVAYGPQELAFETHTEMMRLYFEGAL